MTINYPKKIKVDKDAAVVALYSRDTDTQKTCLPAAVAKLESSDQVVDLIKWANKHSVTLIPVSSTGERRRGDTVPVVKGTVIADVSAMRSLKHADPRDKIAIIEPGVDFATIDTLLKPYGLRAYRPLKPRSGKSVIASYLDREPIIHPDDHWDVSDPMGGTSIVLGSGDFVLTGGAAVEGSIEEQINHGNRHMLQPGPGSIDLLRVVQGSQGSLGIMTWAAVYCQRIPTLEKSWFASADRLDSVMDMARAILHRRLSSTLFVVDNVQLALLMADQKADFAKLCANLPKWTLFVSVEGTHHNPEAKVQWQSDEIKQYAEQFEVELNTTLGDVTADAFANSLRTTSETGYYKDQPYGSHKELFFLRSFSDVVHAVEDMKLFVEGNELGQRPLGTYIQPMVQGVYCHVEFTLPCGSGEQDRQLDACWRDAAKACAESGAFFSRPHGDCRELAFESNSDALKMLSSTKTILDPNGVMNPSRFPYGRFQL